MKIITMITILKKIPGVYEAVARNASGGEWCTVETSSALQLHDAIWQGVVRSPAMACSASS